MASANETERVSNMRISRGPCTCKVKIGFESLQPPPTESHLIKLGLI